MDRSNNLKFNPYDASSNIALSENNTNLENSSKIYGEYYLPSDFNKQLNKASNNNINFSIIHLNTRSIANKFDGFKQLIDSLNIYTFSDNWFN